jgi:septal ring factor EnvC (AmiA/AmiB activator)
MSTTETDVASHTLRLLRDIKRELEGVREVLERQETRLGRLERNTNELKSDLVLIENQMLTRMNESIRLQLKIEEIVERLDASPDDRPSP